MQPRESSRVDLDLLKAAVMEDRDALAAHLMATAHLHIVDIDDGPNGRPLDDLHASDELEHFTETQNGWEFSIQVYGQENRLDAPAAACGGVMTTTLSDNGVRYSSIEWTHSSY